MASNIELQAEISRHEGNMKQSSKWIEALQTCTFHGRHAEDVAAMIAFLRFQHDAAKRAVAEAMDKVKTPQPEFGKPAEKAVA